MNNRRLPQLNILNQAWFRMTRLAGVLRGYISPLKLKYGMGLTVGLLVFLYPISYILYPPVAEAAASQFINVQGKVTNSDGTNVADGVYDFVFNLYDGAGSGASSTFTETWSNAALWSSTMSSAPSAGGTSLTYSSNTNEATIKVGQFLWNVTKQEPVKVVAVNTGTNVITISETVQNWANGDTVTNRVYVKNGIFQVSLNSLNTNWGTTDFNQDNIHLGIEFNNDGEMKPRSQLNSVPYSYRANSAGSVDGLSIAGGKTVTFNNTLTFSGTDSTAFTLPSASTTLVGTDSSQALTNKTYNGLSITANGTNTLNIGAGLTLAVATASKTLTGAGTSLSIGNSIVFGAGTTGTITLGTGANTLQLTTSGNTNVTLPTTGTLATLAGVETLTNKTITTSGLLTASAGFTLSGGTLTLPGNSVTDAMVSNTLTSSIFIGSGSTTNAVDLATAEVSGTLAIANGGTNSTATPTAGGIAYGTGAAYAFTGQGSSGQCLQSNVAGAPTWGTCTSITADSLNFTDLSDSLTLDANTGIAFAGFDLTTSGSGNIDFNHTGDTSFAGGLSYNLSPLNLELSRTLPTVVNDYIEIGSFNVTAGAHDVRISVVVSDSGFSTAKQYLIPVFYNQTSNAWQKVLPLADGGAYGGNNFELNVSSNNAVTTFRLLRTGGATAGTARVRIESVGYSSDAFSSLTGTGTDSSPSTIFASTSLTQTGSKVGIMNAAPSATLDVTGSAAVSGALTAGSFNGLAITANGTNTLNIGAGLTLAVTTASKTLTGAGTQLSIANNLTFGAGTTGTITLGDGSNTLNFDTTNNTSLILPTTGTLATLAGSEALTNKTINGVTVTATTGTLNIANGLTLAVTTASKTLTGAGTSLSIGNSIVFGAGTTGTITLGTGSNTLQLTTTGNTNVTLPTTGTLVTLAGVETLTNKTITTSGLLTASAGFTLSGGTLTLPASSVTDAMVSNTLTSSIFIGSGSTTNAVDLATAEIAGTLANTNLTGSGALTVTAGNGLTGGGSVALGGSTSLQVGAGTGISVGSTTVGFDYSATVAANPGLAAGEAVFGTTGLIFEGSSADTIETLLTAANPTGSDNTITLPDATGTVAVSASGNIALSAAGAITFTGTLPIANGGTNSTATPTAGGIAYGTGTAYAFTGQGSSGECLQSNVAGAPTWGTCTTIAADSLNFTDFADAMTLDASTSIALGSNTLSTSGTGGITFGHSGATTFAGTVTSAGLLTASNGFTLTTGTLSLPSNSVTDAMVSNTLTSSIFIGSGSTTNAVDLATAEVAGTLANANLTGSGALTVTAGNGLSGGGSVALGGSTALAVGAGTGIAVASTTVGFAYTATIAANPALNASEVIFGTTGLIFEGSSADTNELLVTVTNPTGDRTITLPDASGTVAVSASGNIALSAAGAITFTGTLPIASGGTNSTATPTAGGIAYGTGSAYAFTGQGSSGQCLQSNVAGAPTWGTCVSSLRLDQIAAANTTATIANGNNAIAWNWGTLTTQTGMTFGGGTAMTTGSILDIGTGTYVHTGSETGEMMNLTFVDSSTAASGAAVTHGLNINSQISTSGAGTKAVNALNVSAPTLTGCASGACTWSGLRVTTATSGAASTITQNGINVAATGVGSGSLNGVNISAITGSSGTERAIAVGSGWDAILDYNNGTTIINGSGVLQSAGLSGTYSNALTLSSTSNALTAASLQMAGGSNAINVTNSNWSGSNYSELALRSAVSNKGTFLRIMPNGTPGAQPSAILQLFNTDFAADQTNYEGLEFRYNNNVAQLYSSAGGSGTVRPIQITTGANTGINVLADGNVGIGTNSPTSALAVTAPAEVISVTELITNGSFTGSATGWTLDTCAAYGSNQVTMTITGCPGGQYIYQNFTTQSGTRYKLTFDLSGVAGDKVAAYTNDAGTYFYGYQSGTNTFYFTSSVTGSNTITFTVDFANAGATFTLDNVSIKEVTSATSALVVTGSDSNTWLSLGGNLSSNTSLGQAALASMTTAKYNAAVGSYALTKNTSGSYNTGIGSYALYANTTGTNNSANGFFALTANTTGTSNTANGALALTFNTTGGFNTANGSYALYANSTGVSNTATGAFSLGYNTVGGYNTATGRFSLRSNTTGNNNTALGYQAGYTNSTGSANVFLGYMAGYNETGSNKLYIDNSNTSSPLIYGDFSTDALTINGSLGVAYAGTGIMASFDASNSSANGLLIDIQSSSSSQYALNVTTNNGSTNALSVRGDGMVGIGTTTPTAKLAVKGTSSVAVLGSEMISATADRDFSSSTGNWTGTNWSIGSGVITHTAGINDLVLNNTALSSAPVSGNIYQVTYTVVTTTAGTLTPKFGSSTGVSIGQVVGTLTAQRQVFTANGTVALTFSPNGTWAGTIDDVSVKAITPASAALMLENSDGTGRPMEFRTGGSGNDSLYIGANSGQAAYGYGGNTALGSRSLQSIVGGYENTAIGVWALKSVTSARENTAVGAYSLQNNISGAGNVAIGAYNSEKIRSGSFNTSIGELGLYFLTTGSNNVALGYEAGANLTTGSNNLIFGYNVDAPSATASNQLNIGNLLFGTGVDGENGTLSSGNIGIGISSPNEKFSVVSSGTNGLASFDTSNASANGLSVDIQSSSSSQYALRVTTNNGGTTALRAEGNGDVYINAALKTVQNGVNEIHLYDNGFTMKSYLGMTVALDNDNNDSTEFFRVITNGGQKSLLHIDNSALSIGAQDDATSGSYSLVNGAAGTFGAQSTVAGAWSMAQYNGKTYVATNKSNAAGVYRYDGSGTWTLITDSAGKIISGDNATTDNITLTTYNGKLYAGTMSGGSNEAAVYAYDGSSWTLLNATRGTFGADASIDGVWDMEVWNGSLYATSFELNLTGVYRYDGGTTWTRLNATRGKGLAEATADADSGVLVSYGGNLWWGVQTAANTARIYKYDGNTFTLMNTAGTIGGVSTIDDINSMVVYNGQLFVGTGETNLSNIYVYKGGIDRPATPGDDWFKTTATSGRIDATNDTTIIDQIPVLQTYNGRLYAGSYTGTAGNLGALYEFDGNSSWSLIGTRGTFGSQTNIDNVYSLLEVNGALWIGTYDSGSVGAVYTWNKTLGNSLALRFNAGSDHYGAISFVAGSQAQGGSNVAGTFVTTNPIASTSGAFDYAEDYPTFDYNLEAGDIAAIDTNNAEHVKRGDNTTPVIGIVSERPGFNLSQRPELINGDRYLPIALVGRVPVKVSNENGPIQAGDYLTASSSPGVAMKATRPGPVVGRALEGFSGDFRGKIVAFVQPGYADPTQEQPFDPSTLGISDAFNVAKMTRFAVDVTVMGTLKAEGGLVVGGPAEFQGPAIFKALAEFIDRVIFNKDVEFRGRAIFNKDSGGFAEIAIGQTEVAITFEQEYTDQPVINASLSIDKLNQQALEAQVLAAVCVSGDSLEQCQEKVESSVLSNMPAYVVTKKSTTGFTIKLAQPTTKTIKFSWSALAIKDAQTAQN